jgi:hypothetical protein
MAPRRGSSALLILLFLFFGSVLVGTVAFGPQAEAAELTVLVSTDKPEYQSGELVTITVRVLLDGVPVASRIELAYIDIAYDSGSTFRHYITWDFVPVATGVFVAQAKAGPAGLRQVYVAASATITEGCCCRTICASGVAYFSVKPGCACQPCYCYQPCWWWYQPCQPCQPCLPCRPPDFFIKHVLNPAEVLGTKVTFSIPDHIMEQLTRRAGGPVTFREAPPHSVLWSSAPGLGWTNEPLAALGLALDPATGQISGYLTATGDLFESHFFFIEALNAAGQVVAGIWIEIAFI